MPPESHKKVQQRIILRYYSIIVKKNKPFERFNLKKVAENLTFIGKKNMNITDKPENNKSTYNICEVEAK